MQQHNPANQVNQKERTRREIERQVEAFLNQGGRIAVVDNQRQQSAALLGTAWRDYDEAIELLN
jgi:hypothetical protein